MKDKSIIIIVPLNIASYENVQNKDNNNISQYFNIVNKEKNDEVWIKNRINIFMNYTYRSLVNQTNQEFVACIIYDDTTEGIIFSELVKYGELPDNIVFIAKSIADKFIKEKIIDSEYVYFVRIDSDDMYHKSYIQTLFDYKPLAKTISLLNQWGYLYDSFNDKLFVCNAKVTSCYTLIYNTADYLSGAIPSVITDKLDTQMGIAWSIPNKEFLAGLNYVWHVHSKNTLTSSEDWFTKQWTNFLSEPIKDEETINQIMSEFMG